VALQLPGATPTIRNSSTFGADNHFDYSGTGTDVLSPDRVFQAKGVSSAIIPGTSLTIKVTGNFDTFLYVGTGACGDMTTIIASNDNGCGLPNGGSCVNVPVPLLSTVYFIYVEGTSQSAVGDFSIQLELVGP
jgi:hypothetical protein